MERKAKLSVKDQLGKGRGVQNKKTIRTRTALRKIVRKFDRAVRNRKIRAVKRSVKSVVHAQKDSKYKS